MFVSFCLFDVCCALCVVRCVLVGVRCCSFVVFACCDMLDVLAFTV